jgi:hypothetical protein
VVLIRVAFQNDIDAAIAVCIRQIDSETKSSLYSSQRQPFGTALFAAYELALWSMMTIASHNVRSVPVR